MWTYLPNWIIQDGEIPELTVGDQVRDVGIRLYYDHISTGPGLEIGEAAVASPTSLERYRYTVTGVITRATGGEFVYTVLNSEAGYLFLEPTSLPSRKPPTDLSHAEQIPTGTLVRVSGTAEVMAYYEVEGYVPPLVADRTVRALAVERRTLVPDTGKPHTFSSGEVTSVESIDRMRRWDDDPSSGSEHVTYLLRLDTPLTRPTT